jgi:hypothetical protein
MSYRLANLTKPFPLIKTALQNVLDTENQLIGPILQDTNKNSAPCNNWSKYVTNVYLTGPRPILTE